MGNAPSSVPYGAQINLLNFSAPCAYNGTMIDIIATVSATSPLSAGSGQQFYFSDVTASITFPPSISQLSASLSQYTANVTIDLDTNNLSPSDLILNEFVGYNSFNSPGPSVVFPQNGGVLAPLGPVTVTGPAGQAADLRLKAINITLQYAAVDNTNIGPPYEIVCNSNGGPPIISTAVIDTSSGPALAPSNGVPGTFPDTPVGNRSTVANIPLDCSESLYISGGHDLNFTLQGTGPAQTVDGYTYNITNVQNFLTIPGTLVYDVDAYYGGNTSGIFVTLGKDYNGEDLPGRGLGVDYVFAAVQSLDVARQFVASDRDNTPNPLSTGRYVAAGSHDSVVFAFPNTGFLTLPTYSAYGGTQGADGFSVVPRVIQGSISGYSIDYGKPEGALNFNCTPKATYLLIRAPLNANFGEAFF